MMRVAAAGVVVVSPHDYYNGCNSRQVYTQLSAAVVSSPVPCHTDRCVPVFWCYMYSSYLQFLPVYFNIDVQNIFRVGTGTDWLKLGRQWSRASFLSSFLNWFRQESS
jgi:hypothetical protein